MLDFDALRNGDVTLAEMVADLTVADLRRLTNEMIDTMLALIVDCRDENVTFQPLDPDANDPYASDAEEVNMPWTLGHLIVHTTASAEESAFLAAEMARGVENHGRSRSEVPWQTVTTIAQCRARLEESRRMRLASLDLWPDQPYLDLTYQSRPGAPRITAVGRFVFGLRHDHNHLGQIADVVGQAERTKVTK